MQGRPRQPPQGPGVRQGVAVFQGVHEGETVSEWTNTAMPDLRLLSQIGAAMEDTRKPFLVASLDVLRAAIAGTDLRLVETPEKRWPAELEGVRVLVAPYLNAGVIYRFQVPLSLTDAEIREELLRMPLLMPKFEFAEPSLTWRWPR